MGSTLIMEGYDRALIGNFWALPAFSRRYGVYVPSKGTYTVEAPWQLGITNGVQAGAFRKSLASHIIIVSILLTDGLSMLVGSLAAGWLVERFGYRKTVIANLLIMVPLIGMSVPLCRVTRMLMGVGLHSIGNICTKYRGSVYWRIPLWSPLGCLCGHGPIVCL